MTRALDDTASAKGFPMAELVERTSTRAATVRFYLAEGLLPAPRRVASNRFLYDERHVEIVRLVRLLRERRHLSIEAIKRMLPELLPDLVGKPEGGAFRPEMWHLLLAAHTQPELPPSMAGRLLEAGIELFSRSGYSDVSVDDVCRAARVAKGTFYRHYHAKEELFFAVVRTVIARIAVAFVPVLSAIDGQEKELIAAIGAEIAPFVVIVLDLSSLAVQESPGCPEVLDEVLDRLSRLLPSDLADPREIVLRAVVSAALQRVSQIDQSRARTVVSLDGA